MTDREPEQAIARLEADAARGRVVVYLPAKDVETGECSPRERVPRALGSVSR
ncbi:MAG: hypothetical protein JWM10_5332 [Myxococcaceae bacterium]|nr:hypothetical protein [Myxococcaceae bacterium]